MGPLIRLDKTLIGDRYKSILPDQLHPFISIVHSNGLGNFSIKMQQPTRPEFLHSGSRHSAEFRHFHWPPKSLDMNIFEYTWNALQPAVQKRSPPLLTPTDLWTALQDSWCQLPQALLQTLIESTQCTLGVPTRY
ncbi:transposable element tcb2 transposase [Trichonephila clavipes]|nr:transposable element tcb2 transposase [Trichonephila clavipes]